MTSTKAKRHRHVYRVDRDVNKTHCWRVAIRRKNQAMTRSFSDGKYGSKRKALQAALAWRDATLVAINLSKAERHDHVCRVVNGSRAHWLVEVRCRRHVAKQVFSDIAYGGKNKALQAALAWRDAMLIVAERDLWLRRVTLLRRDNSSGVVGIGRYVSREVQGDKLVERASWHASWLGGDGKRRNRKFAVRKYGEKGAKSLAQAARAAGVAELLASGRQA